MQIVTTNMQMQMLLHTTAHGMLLQVGINIQVSFKQNGAQNICHNKWKEPCNQQPDGAQVSETDGRDAV